MRSVRKKNPFINRLREADPALYEDMLKYGRRNIACLTIAPTGTTSLTAPIDGHGGLRTERRTLRLPSEVGELVKLLAGRSAGVISRRACRVLPIRARPWLRSAIAAAFEVVPLVGPSSTCSRSWPRDSTDSRSLSTDTSPSSRPSGPGRSASSNAAPRPKDSRGSSSRPPYRNVKLLRGAPAHARPGDAADPGGRCGPGERIITRTVAEWQRQPLPK